MLDHAALREGDLPPPPRTTTSARPIMCIPHVPTPSSETTLRTNAAASAASTSSFPPLLVLSSSSSHCALVCSTCALPEVIPVPPAISSRAPTASAARDVMIAPPVPNARLSTRSRLSLRPASPSTMAHAIPPTIAPTARASQRGATTSSTCLASASPTAPP